MNRDDMTDDVLAKSETQHRPTHDRKAAKNLCREMAGRWDAEPKPPGERRR